ncbi:hypothetical protein MOC74_21710 [Bacillus haynesii]|uniref:hypothetical protein n=1 Tax=Bacillus haynesii TaxID=1925021 RepID=UPI002281E416|nr:hypothetical protein [Bacillus haynesii]MCY8348042.1 hypothetical protein [Bacillus haynesii]
MKKRIFSLLMLMSAFVLVLAACQQADPKGSYAAAYKKLISAKSYELTSDISLKIDTSNLDDKNLKIAEVLNQSKFTINLKTNMETKESEAVFKGKIKVKNITLDVNVPVYVDEKKQLGYMKLDSFINYSGLLFRTPRMYPENLKGKYLEFSLDEDEPTSEETEEIQKQMMESIQKASENLPEDKFKKAELTNEEKEQGAAQKLTFQFNDKEIKAALIKLIEIAGDATGKTVQKNELANIKEGFQNITFKKFDVTSTIDNKENLLTEKANISVAVDNKDVQRSFDINAFTTYKNIDGKITFDHKPKKEDIVTEEEFRNMTSDDDQEDLHDLIDQETIESF